MAAVFRCLDPALTIAAGLNTKSPFIKPPGLELEANRAKDAFQLGDPPHSPRDLFAYQIPFQTQKIRIS